MEAVGGSQMTTLLHIHTPYFKNSEMAHEGV